MNTDPASLENLRDIAVPPPVSWWPPAPGWWVVLATLGVVGLALGWRAWLAWKKNAYRRQALRELGRAATPQEIAEILKRTALAAFPRSNVASLSGDAWCSWLGSSCGTNVPSAVQATLTESVFGGANNASLEELRAYASKWIEHHGEGAEQASGKPTLTTH